MGTGSIVKIVIAGLVVATAIGLVHQIKERARFKLLAAQKQAAIDSLNARVTSDSLALVEVERWARDSLANLEAAAVEAEERIVSWRRESRRTHRELSEMVGSLPDTLQQRVNTAVANLVKQHQQEVIAYEELVGNLRQRNNILNEQLVATQRLNASLYTALDEANEQIEFYKAEASPGFFKSIKGDLPKLAVAFGLGYLTAEVLN